MREIVEHKDILGKTIAIGDVVAMSAYNSLAIAVVDKINPKMIRLKDLTLLGHKTNIHQI